MNQDIQSQFDRAKELLHELEVACNIDLQAKDISGKTKNLSPEVLQKVKRLLDQSIYRFFEKYYLPNLAEVDKKSAKVYFPIVSKKDDLKSVLGRAKMDNLETAHQDFYKFIDSIQPYNQDYLWLKHLAYYAADTHIRLTPQKKTETKRVTVSRGCGSVFWEAKIPASPKGVTFGNGVSIMDVPVDPATQMPVPNNIVETKVENWVSFLFDDSDINVIWLCKKSVEDGEKIVTETLKFIE